MIREQHNSREEWLNARSQIIGIGASEAGLICGCKGAYGNIDELYNEKLGISKHKEITNDRIENGVQSEPIIRDLFAQAHKDRYRVEYHGFDLLRMDNHPEIFCTLDGEIIDTLTEERGILEIKRIEADKKAVLEAWDGEIPDYYLCQQIHQMNVCDTYAFNILVAELVITDWVHTINGFEKRPFKRIEFRYNAIRRDEENFQQNANAVLEKELQFLECLKNHKRPATLI